MKNSVFIILGIALLYISLSSFIAYGGDLAVPAVILNEEILLAEEAAVEIDNDKDYYGEYLQELNATGPKEVRAESIVSVTSNTIDPPVQAETSSEKVKSPTIAIEMQNVTEEKVAEEKDLVGVVDHSPFGALLQKHVNSKGGVNYQAFKNDEAKLDNYLDQLRSNPTNKDMGKNERLSYWINVYNAFTIKLILENYPVNSIQDINGGKPWDKQFITLGNTTYSLNMVENEVIRKRFTEPRIHFAVNCAAKSCPPLLNDAFYPDRLTNQLAARTAAFLGDSSYNTITSSKLEVSKIFDWYGVDFGDVKSYLKSKTKTDITGLDLKFKEYDWSLNKQ